MLIKVFILLSFSAFDVALGNEEIRLAPGDDKTGYAQADYESNSLSLEQRVGQAENLMSMMLAPQLGLPALTFPGNNQPDRLKIALGRLLFFDRRLSRNKTMSCAMCHVPEQGFTSNELSRPIGFEGRSVKRNAPTLLNVAYYPRLFFDSREYSLELQIWSPLLAANEMNNPSIGYVIETVRQLPEYRGLFEQAFGEPANLQNIGMAIAQYERTLIAADSKFDRWLYGNQGSALNSQEITGYRLFIGKARCSTCHHIQQEHALFTDNLLHNTGLGYRDSMAPSDPVTVQLAPGISTQIDQRTINSVGNQKLNDLGRYEVTLDPLDRWKFRTPSLRNIALTAPYMHNGSLSSLQDVIEFYNRGGVQNESLSPLIQPLGLTDDEQTALVAFLNSLTGKNVRKLVSDAFAVPVGNPGTLEVSQ